MAFVCDVSQNISPSVVQVNSFERITEKIDGKRRFSLDRFVRGYPIPCEISPRIFLTSSKRKKLPDVCFHERSYWLVTKRGKDFFEEYAPGDCHYCPAELWRYVTRKSKEDGGLLDVPSQLIDPDCFAMYPLKRFDAVDWGKSAAKYSIIEGHDLDDNKKIPWTLIAFGNDTAGNQRKTGAGLVIDIKIIGKAQIWRDNLMGAPYGLHFLTNKLKREMEKAKLASFKFLPADEY